jgi:hypothetical protein
MGTLIIFKERPTFNCLMKKERKIAFLRNLLFFITFLIGTIFSIMYLVVKKFENWVEYQIVITIMVIIIFFMGFFFFSALHYIIRKG